MEKNYYSILGISKTASASDIKKAYRNLSKKWHPDMHVKDTEDKKKEAEEKFKEINEAYAVLSDETKRKQYDTFGTVNDNPNARPGGFNPFDIFANEFGRFSKSRPNRERGEDLKIEINVSFENLYSGVHKKIKIQKQVKCKHCHGSGSENHETIQCHVCGGSGWETKTAQTPFGYQQVSQPCSHCHGTGFEIKDPCKYCHGTGLENKEVEIEFNIPAGMPDSAYFTIQGAGNEGPRNGIPGDLHVIVHELPSEKGLTRDEHGNVWYDLKVSYTDMVFGADVEIPLVKGYQKIHIVQGTQNGKVITLKGLGFPIIDEYGGTKDTADYKLRITCDIPEINTLSDKAESLLRDYAKEIKK